MAIVTLKDWSERKEPALQIKAIQSELTKRCAVLPDAQVTAFAPPAIPGLGATGGVSFAFQATGDQNSQELSQATQNLLGKIMQSGKAIYAFTSFDANTPMLHLDIDRDKAEAMKVPISNRLLLCAEFVPRGSRAADIGTDHGYLSIYLLREGICPFVTAADLREQPLQKARENAARFGVSEKMRFFLSDGLQGIPPDAADTIIMAGMGGDLMVRILEAAPWVCDDRYTLILQPQSAGQALRQYLAEHSFAIEREALAKDGHFFYTVLRAKRGHMPPLSPGQQYASPQLLRADGPLLGPYLARIETALAGTVLGLQRADEPEKLRYYETALAEIREMRKQHDDCS